jgi:hypothetical protein
LEEYAEHMRRFFIGQAHVGVRDDLQRSMDEVAHRIVELGEERFAEYLQLYRYLTGDVHVSSPQLGVRELWKWLSLIHLLEPEWQFTESEYSNLELQSEFIHLLYSLRQDPMRDLVFDFAERMAKGHHRPVFKTHGFPRRLVLGNTYREDVREDDDENLCEHCRPAQQAPLFHQIIPDIGHTDSRGILQGVDPNRVGEVRITCHDCLHDVRTLPDLDAILKRLGEVI